MNAFSEFLGAAGFLLIGVSRWAVENWRLVLPVVMGVWGLFLLSELRRGFEHVSAQLAAVNARLGALQEVATKGHDRLQTVEDHLQQTFEQG